MTKMIGFSRSSSGELVYRKTGALAPSSYEVRGNRVYADGRLRGYIGKPTKTQGQRIERASANRARRKRRGSKPRWSFMSASIAQTFQGLIDRRVISIRQASNNNFAKHLSTSVERGLITEERAEEMFQEFIDASDERRCELWEDVKEDQQNSWGYTTSDPLELDPTSAYADVD